MSNVQPGDLAKIVGDHEAAGTLVTVVGPVPDDVMRKLIRRHRKWAGCDALWMCRLLNGVRGGTLDGVSVYLMPGDEVMLADKYLRRIDPEPDAEAMPRVLEQEVPA